MKVVTLSCFLLLVSEASAQDLSAADRAGIKIFAGKASVYTDKGYTNFDPGPVTGNMLNIHYFPALRDYSNGQYNIAERDLTFVINHPNALDENPRRGEFYSTAHYTRGMIYLYHASGIGRHRLARADFEAAIKWNPMNFVAYLEISRVYSQLGLKDAAVSSLRKLLDLKPDKTTTDQALMELKKLGVDPK